jgi:argininosuccinate lyase
MFDVRKFSWDMSLFLSQEFNLLKINKKYLTGSSIMPNKNNPDVIELLRANYAILAGQSSELENLISLPSGYHRDLQLTKKSLVESFQTVMKSLEILPDLIKSIVIDKELSNSFIDDEMRMTDRVYDLVAKGTPFRDAYNIIKSSEVSNAVTKGNKTNSSEGSPFNLNLNKLQKRLNKQKKLK